MRRLGLASIALYLCTASAVAQHVHAPAGPESNWSLDLWLIVPLSAMVVLYVAGMMSLRKRDAVGAVPLWKRMSFAAAMFTLFVALVSPLAELGERIFSLHMGQHELLILVAAPLMVIATPAPVMLLGLPGRARDAVASIFRNRDVTRVWRAATSAVPALLIHAIVLWVWHIPVLWEAALADEGLHAFQHITFFATAALFWWAIVQGRYGRVGYGVAVVFVFVTAMHSSLLGALITFSEHIWYPSYRTAAEGWSLTPAEDQQLAGLLMWIPSGILFMLVGLALFAAWLGESERRQRLAEPTVEEAAP